MPAKADIAVVVHYRPFKLFPWMFYKHFRFTGQYVDNWQWTKQPSEEVQKDADAAIEDHMNKIPDSR